jgi:hypothetical protein
MIVKSIGNNFRIIFFMITQWTESDQEARLAF